MVLKPFRKVFLWWLLPASVTVVAIAIGQGFEWSQVHSPLLSAASSLLGTTALFLFRSEKHAGSRAVFLNFSIFFLGNGVAGPMQSIISKWLGFLHDDISNLLYPYLISLYFLLLSISVVYLVIECTSRKSRVLGKYLVTSLMVGAVWTPLYYHYLFNPRYLYETEEMRDLRAVRTTLEGLRSIGNLDPSAGEIATTTNSNTANDIARPLTETRVSEILPYTHENDFAILFYRPFWRSCAWISTFAVVFMVGFFCLRYFSDPPGSAYLEKIAWCIMLYCLLEAIHFYHFMNVASWDVAVGFIRVGGFVSLAVMIPLGYLFALRYAFINTIEGSYYERQLSREASRITRWRDVLDNWVIQQFMNESNLNRRFLIRDERVESKDFDTKQ